MTPEALAALHALAFDEAPRSWTATEFAMLAEQQATLIVGGDAGFALGRVAGPEGELLTLAVHPDARRSGLGTALVTAFEAAAAARGAEEVFLEVAQTNTAARALYARLGYATAGCRPGYYLRREGPPVDALVLRKAIARTSAAASSGQETI